MHRSFLAIVLAIALVLGFADPASAHATLVSADPADGTVVDSLPNNIELVFSEPIAAAASTAELVDADGNILATSVVAVADNPNAIMVVVDDVPEGLYSLRWSAFSSTDGHVTRGMLVWGVGAVDLADAAFSEPASRANPLEVAGRWIFFAGLAVALGATVVERAGAAPLRRRYTAPADVAWFDDASSRVERMQLKAVLLASAAAAALVALQVITAWRSSGLGLATTLDITIFSSAWGRFVGLRLMLMLLAVVAVTRGGRRATIVTPALIGAALVMHAASGHAGGLRDVVVAVANDVVHLGTSLAWTGTILVLALSWRRSEQPRHAELRRARTASLSGVVVAIAATAVVTGVLAIGDFVRSVDALVRSDYGTMLSLKITLVTVLVVVGLVGRLGGHGRRTLARSAAALAAVVLLVVAAVTATSPANGGEWLAPSDGTAGQVALASNDIQVGLEVTPNVPGQNFLLLDVASTRRPEPAPIARVIARIDSLDVDRSRLSVDAVPVEPAGSYEFATTAFSIPGRYSIDVIVRRLGLPDEHARFDWTVATADPEPAVLSHRALADITDPIGLLAAGLLATALVSVSAIGHRRERRLRDIEMFAAAEWEKSEVERS